MPTDRIHEVTSFLSAIGISGRWGARWATGWQEGGSRVHGVRDGSGWLLQELWHGITAHFFAQLCLNTTRQFWGGPRAARRHSSSTRVSPPASPHPCSRQTIFAAEVDESMRVASGAGGGVADHGEAIEVLALPVDSIPAFVLDQELGKSAGILFSLTWLQAQLARNGGRLFAAA